MGAQGVGSNASGSTQTGCPAPDRCVGLRNHGYRVQGVGVLVSGSGLGVGGVGFERVRNNPNILPSTCERRLGCGVSGFGFRVSDFGFRVSGFGLRASGFECRRARAGVSSAYEGVRSRVGPVFLFCSRAYKRVIQTLLSRLETRNPNIALKPRNKRCKRDQGIIRICCPLRTTMGPEVCLL